jgi:hypothetical protein
VIVTVDVWRYDVLILAIFCVVSFVLCVCVCVLSVDNNNITVQISIAYISLLNM